MGVMFVDAEYEIREWLKTVSAIDALVDDRVFFGIPKNFSKTSSMPVLVIRRLGGGPQRSETPVDDARLTFDCWGASKHDASELAATLVDAIQSRPDAQVESWSWTPDAAQDIPRYVVDAVFSLTAESS